jgi:hypothetical protein
MSPRSSNTSQIASRLKLYFAILSCLGGLVLSAGSDTESIPIIAVFFAVFGYLFVDVLELFALPPLAAYAAMGWLRCTASVTSQTWMLPAITKCWLSRNCWFLSKRF